MDLEFEQIGADEYAERSQLYEPLAAAVRALVAASLHTGVNPDTVRDATMAIEAVTEKLDAEQDERLLRFQRHEGTGRPVVWSNPVIGVRNPLAPPLTVHHEPGGRCWSEFTLGRVYEGPPGLVHGGISAMILDQLLGEVATDQLTTPKYTGTITVKFLRGTPLGHCAPKRSSNAARTTRHLRADSSAMRKDRQLRRKESSSCQCGRGMAAGANEVLREQCVPGSD